ncbi:hypothetical protein AHiyo8_09040 [Arthrobacter sp. Hiyo8]|nr:hypothetical protein AHiyo8_09040 [Arthrobacter sp. Hiyo8]
MEINLRDHWDSLSPETRQWLTENPGCVVLPRTITETIHQETGITADSDQHDQAPLSPEDLDFLRAGPKQRPPRRSTGSSTQYSPEKAEAERQRTKESSMNAEPRPAAEPSHPPAPARASRQDAGRWSRAPEWPGPPPSPPSCS